MVLLIRRVVCVFLALVFLVGSAGAEGFDSLVRLHVIAADDTPSAQGFKLEIRDAILHSAQELLSTCADADEAWQVLNDHLSDFLAAAVARAEELGHFEKLSVQAGIFAFPDRIYGDVVVPAGDYRALRVIIGEGEGQNWWCVLYPNLCLPGDGGYSSLLLDWLGELFGGDAS